MSIGLKWLELNFSANVHFLNFQNLKNKKDAKKPLSNCHSYSVVVCNITVNTDLRLLSQNTNPTRGWAPYLHKWEYILNWSGFVLLTKLLFPSENDRSSKQIFFFPLHTNFPFWLNVVKWFCMCQVGFFFRVRGINNIMNKMPIQGVRKIPVHTLLELALLWALF